MGITMNTELETKLANKLTGLFKSIIANQGVRIFTFCVTLVFLVHMLGLGIASFIMMKSLVVSGLDVVSMEVWQRVVLVIFYLIIPLAFAGWRTLKPTFHELTDNKETDS